MASKKKEQNDGHRQRRPVDERTNGRGLVRRLVPKNVVRLRSNDLVRPGLVDDFFYLPIIVMNPSEAQRIHITMDTLAIVLLGPVAETGTELRRLFLSRQYVDRISTSKDTWERGHSNITFNSFTATHTHTHTHTSTGRNQRYVPMSALFPVEHALAKFVVIG